MLNLHNLLLSLYFFSIPFQIIMSKYFNKTKECSWNLFDAYNSFTEKCSDETTTQQKLDRFHAYLKSHQDSKVQSLLKHWKSFYKRVMDADDGNNYTSKNVERDVYNTFNTTNNFTNSSRAVNIGEVKSYSGRKPASDFESEKKPFEPELTSFSKESLKHGWFGKSGRIII